VRTITLANNKGGSGKTTTTVSLAAALGELGHRVLVIDLDPQGSATQWLGGHESPLGLVEYASGGMRVTNIVVGTTARGVELIPTSPSLVPPADRRENDTGMAIVRGFARLPDYWDFVLVDTPPTLGYLSLAPLVASEHVVIPVEAHALALPGVATVITSIERARRNINPGLGLLGIVACRVNTTAHTRDIVARLRTQFGSAVLEHTVREGIRVAEAPALHLPITRYAAASLVAADYRAVAAELVTRLGDGES
jgi:chromosome partitioning protein